MSCGLVDRNASSATDSSDFTGADVSGGAVLAGSIGSRPLRDLFVAVLSCLSLRFPLELWALPPQAGLCTAEQQGSQGELFGTQGLICCHAPCEVSRLPAIAAVIASAVSEALRKLSNCGIKSGPAANDLVVMSAKHSFKSFD